MTGASPMPVPPGAVWASLPVPALLIGADDRIAGMNPAAELFFNASARGLVGLPVGSELAIDTDLAETLARVRANQAPLFVMDVETGLKGRAASVCNLQLAPVADLAPMVLMLISPQDLAGRLGRGKQVTSAARSAIGMAEMLAHEIKNPLAGISGAAQLLSMSVGKEDRELTELIVAETKRVVKLLEQVEQFGNLLPPDRQAINLHDVLDRARRTAQLGFGAGVRFVEDYDPSLPDALADPDQLVRMFQNLLRNAAQAIGEKDGTIRLKTFYDHGLRRRRPDGSGAALPLQIEITDDGPGIPPELAGAIFEPFVSGRENGTGLGLALVSKIISDHDGWIAVESRPGRTTFRVSLPVAGTEAG
ncbi:MAG: ATP-binding protein [Paracoccaceae bacterium]